MLTSNPLFARAAWSSVVVVGSMVGVPSIGLVPLRRTIAREQLLVIVATRYLCLWLAPRCGWLVAAMRATKALEDDQPLHTAVDSTAMLFCPHLGASECPSLSQYPGQG